MNGHNSTFKTIKYGVPQGCRLGPILFVIFMNNLLLCVEYGHVTMYADNTSSSDRIKSVNDIVSKVVPDVVPCWFSELTSALQQKSSSARFKHRYYGQSH